MRRERLLAELGPDLNSRCWHPYSEFICTVSESMDFIVYEICPILS